MSFTFGFYNALNHDRRYNAIEMSRIFDGLLTDGVYPTVGHKMMVRASGTNNSVIVGSGRAWFNHSWNYNDADMPLTGPAPHILYPRWDAIVLDINSSNEYRTNSIIWVTGTAASSPVKPTMVHTETHNQYPLAYIYRPANDNTISANRITNPIGTAECPYAGGLLVDRKNIAQLENNDYATKAYAQGEYLIWYDQLYKVTTAISQGAAIIAYPASRFNIKPTMIATELYEKFVYDTTPTSGSNHPVTSDGIYRALGNNKIIQPTTTVNQNDPTNGKAVITSKGLYTALGNRTKIETSAPASGGTNLITNGQVYTALGNRTKLPDMSAPASGGTNMISNGQVYTAIGNRTQLSIWHGDMQDHQNSWANYELPTTYTLSIALGNKHKLQPTDTFGQTHSNPNCEYVMTSKAFKFGAPASGDNKFITNGQVYAALGNRSTAQRISILPETYAFDVTTEKQNTNMYFAHNISLSGPDYYPIFLSVYVTDDTFKQNTEIRNIKFYKDNRTNQIIFGVNVIPSFYNTTFHFKLEYLLIHIY